MDNQSNQNIRRNANITIGPQQSTVNSDETMLIASGMTSLLIGSD